MTFAFGHLIFAWIIGKSYEIISKKKIPHLAWGFLLLGAILPDIDFIIGKFFTEYIHRTFTHSIIFLLIITALTYIFVRIFNSKSGAKKTAIFIAIGIASHLIIDMFYYPGIQLFWPWDLFISYFGVGYYTSAQLGAMSIAGLAQSMKEAVIDMGIGTAWIFYLWYRRRIKF